MRRTKRTMDESVAQGMPSHDKHQTEAPTGVTHHSGPPISPEKRGAPVGVCGGGEEICRALGTYERFRADLYDIGFHYNVSVVAIFTVPSHLVSDPTAYQTHLLRAVTALVRQHPNLRLQIRRESPDRFVQLRVIDVQSLVAWRPVVGPFPLGEPDRARYLKDLLSEQNSLPFTDPNKPLWRVICLDITASEADPEKTSSHELAVCFVYHHAIADGMSGSAIMASLRDTLCSEAMTSERYSNEDKNDKDLFKVQALPSRISPSMDEVVPYHVTCKFRLHSVLNRYWQRWGPSSNTPVWAGDIIQLRDDAVPTRTLIRVIMLPAPATRRLREKCRAHGTSVTAMLQVLVGLAIFRQYPEAKALRCATALSLRRFFHPSAGIDDAAVGVWIDAFAWPYKRGQFLDDSGRNLDDGVLWRLAARSKKKIDLEVSKGLKDLSFASLRGTPDFKSQLRGMIGKPRKNSYSITNLGLLPGRTEPSGDWSGSTWRLRNVVFSQSAHVNGSAVQFCIVTCEAGGMSISMNWQEGVVQESDMDEVKALLEDSLRRWSI